MTKSIQNTIREIYGHVPDYLVSGIEQLADKAENRSNKKELWSQKDIVLITYADQVRGADESAPGPKSPLSTLKNFLIDHRLDHLLSCVHLLPFCPYSSDDGFSVIDYLAVDSASGTWEDIDALGQSFDLMFDLVLNHSSKQHSWFQRYLEGDSRCANFYIDQDPRADLSKVVRPRSLPLLTEFDSPSGKKHIWTTFSSDQVDLNYANPKVMLAMLETLVEYARKGARIIRLDAIAFLWKQPGTTCIHLPQTHAAVRLMRQVLDLAAPGTLILTETNVPHRENISYFGSGNDEAHMVYQFSLPPLLLDAIHSGDTGVLADWIASLDPPTPSTTFFNFTASHDGIGVRPLEGLVSKERVEKLAETVRKHGGRVSTRQAEDGTDRAYELNISYVDAVADRRFETHSNHSRKFLATQAIMLAMAGMPAIYFHSLVGTPNDEEAVRSSGQNRRINRRKYDQQELGLAISDPNSLQRRIFDGYRRLIKVRRSLTAFHPIASQNILDLPRDGLIGFVRGDDDSRIAVIANLSNTPREINANLVPEILRFDVLAEEQCLPNEPIPMRPFQVRYLSKGIDVSAG